MGAAPKTKTQAQKREERQAQIDAAAEERKRMSDQVAEAKRQAYLEDQAASKTLSKKERRALAKQASVEAQASSTAKVQSSRARLVELNHSTYLDGLIDVLRRAVHQLPGSFTIVPGKLRNTGRAKQGILTITSQRELLAGGESDDEEDDDEVVQDALSGSSNDDAPSCGGTTYKFRASLGGSHQDVFVRGPADSLDAVDRAIQKSFEKCGQVEANLVREEEGEALADMSEVNRLAQAERDAKWRDDHQETHLRNIQLNKEGQERVRLQERERTLKTKVSNEQAAVYASRDQEIVEGAKRTKNSMK